jgi:putative ABC transport system permease protein
LKGRDFTERDGLKSAPVVIINETLAKRFFPDEDPVGKHIRPTIGVDEDEPLMREIIGVVGDVRHKSLSEESGPEVYVPHAQIPFDFMTLVARTENNPRAIIPAVQEEVRALDKDLPVYEFTTLDEYVANSLAQPRFNTMLLAIFAALALALTAVGLYGVVSYSVAQRTHEMGIRMALGAKPSDVLRLVVGQGMVLALIGIGIGLVGAFLTTRVMASLLFGVSTTDPLTFTLISVILIGVALGACFVPARRATRVDPMVALRYE